MTDFSRKQGIGTTKCDNGNILEDFGTALMLHNNDQQESSAQIMSMGDLFYSRTSLGASKKMLESVADPQNNLALFD